MSLPWLTLALALTLGGQVWIADLFRESSRWRKNQIYLDNTVIEMGKSDRFTLNQLRKANQALNGLEAIHHVLHACARVPLTAVKCKPLDRALEATIKRTLDSAEKVSMALWKKNTLEGYGKLKALKPLGTSMERQDLKIGRTRCSLCWLENKLVVKNENLETRLFARSVPRDLQSGYDLEETGGKGFLNYDYLLIPDRVGLR